LPAIRRDAREHTDMLLENERFRSELKLTQQLINERRVIAPMTQHEESYWYNYGRNDHFHRCENDLGFGLVSRWRKEKREYCSPTSSNATRVNCFKIQQTSHTGMDNFCTVENLLIDTNEIGVRSMSEFSF
jgi:NDP-sugar pyrophosphorylase family protein